MNKCKKKLMSDIPCYKEMFAFFQKLQKYQIVLNLSDLNEK